MIGQNDFIEYWSAFRALLANSNLYDPSILAPIQQSQGFAATPPLMMWNPPWALLLLYPILVLGFSLSSKLWILVNLAIAGLATLLLLRTYRVVAKEHYAHYIAAFSFVPVLTCLELGQISMLLLLGLSATLYFFKEERDFLAGCCLSLLSIKPHLFLVFGLLLAIIIVRQGRYRIALGTLCTMSVLLASTYLVSSNALSFWLQSVLESPLGAPAKLSWITPTLVGALRYLLADSHGSPVWPVVVLPGLSLIVLLSISMRYIESNRLQELVPISLALSFILSPFGWIFDAVILLPIVVLSFRDRALFIGSMNIVVLLTFFLLLQIATLWLHGQIFTGHHTFLWYPLMLAFLEVRRLTLSCR